MLLELFDTSDVVVVLSVDTPGDELLLLLILLLLLLLLLLLSLIRAM